MKCLFLSVINFHGIKEGEPPYYKILNQALEISLKEACKVYINYVFEHQLILYPHDWLLEARQYLNEFN